MPFVKPAGSRADLEAQEDQSINPAIARIGKRDKRFSQEDAEDARGCSCSLLRKGWFWACVICVVVVCVVVPIGVRETKRRNDPVTDPPSYKFQGGGLNTSMLFDPLYGLPTNASLTCEQLQPDLPNVTASGKAPPPLSVKGAQLVRPDGKPAALHGLSWGGFQSGQTMVDGLAAAPPTWEAADFATIVHQLKLLGFNAIRLPIGGDLLSQAPQDFARPCPDQQPSAAELGARTTPPGAPKPAATPPALALPPGSQAGVCNAYLPGGQSTLSRFAWVVNYLVSQGLWVVVSLHPGPADPALESVQAYTNAWLRVWMALSCLPTWDKQLKGRVFLDLMNEPDALGLRWGGAEPGKAALEAYYLGAMDAIQAQSPGETLFLLQGGGQDKLGTAWGDGFATDPALIRERGLADPTTFFTQLAAKPYRTQAVLAPHLYGPSVTKSPDTGPQQWAKYEASWGKLQAAGFCADANASSAAAANASSKAGGNCTRFPVVAGEIGSALAEEGDLAYMADAAAFMRKAPATAEYASAPFDDWFWWAYGPNSGATGGLVAKDWSSLQWPKLAFMQKELGLKPWHSK